MSLFEIIQSECEKIQTRITPNTDTFYAVHVESRFYDDAVKMVEILWREKQRQTKSAWWEFSFRWICFQTILISGKTLLDPTDSIYPKSTSGYTLDVFQQRWVCFDKSTFKMYLLVLDLRDIILSWIYMLLQTNFFIWYTYLYMQSMFYQNISFYILCAVCWCKRLPWHVLDWLCTKLVDFWQWIEKQCFAGALVKKLY